MEGFLWLYTEMKLLEGHKCLWGFHEQQTVQDLVFLTKVLQGFTGPNQWPVVSLEVLQTHN